MRSFFIVSSKILGIFCIYLGIFQFPYLHLSIAFGLMSGQEPNPGIYFFITILSFILSIVFGLFLVFKAELIADKLQIEDSDISKTEFPIYGLTRIGVILICFFILMEQIPVLFKIVYETIQRPDIFNIRFLGIFVQTCVGILLAIFALSKSELITGIILRDRRS